MFPVKPGICAFPFPAGCTRLKRLIFIPFYFLSRNSCLWSIIHVPPVCYTISYICPWRLTFVSIKLYTLDWITSHLFFKFSSPFKALPLNEFPGVFPKILVYNHPNGIICRWCWSEILRNKPVKREDFVFSPSNDQHIYTRSLFTGIISLKILPFFFCVCGLAFCPLHSKRGAENYCGINKFDSQLTSNPSSHDSSIFPARYVNIQYFKVWFQFLDYLFEILNIIDILLILSGVATTRPTIKSSLASLIWWILCKITIFTRTLSISNSNPLFWQSPSKSINFSLSEIVFTLSVDRNQNWVIFLNFRDVHEEITIVMGVKISLIYVNLML